MASERNTDVQAFIGELDGGVYLKPKSAQFSVKSLPV